METIETKKFSRNLTRWAIAASATYVGLLVYLGWGRWPQLLTKDLNEVGDFLAGAFSPLAFLWLVVGYFQQGRDLSQNTEALLLQHKEMQASVKQASELVATAKQEQAATEKRWVEERKQRSEELRVKLVCSSQYFREDLLKDGLIGNILGFHFRNFGGEAIDLRVRTFESAVMAHVSPNELVEFKGQLKISLQWHARNIPSDTKVIEMGVAYSDRHGDRFEDVFEIEGNWHSRQPAEFLVRHERMNVLTL